MKNLLLSGSIFMVITLSLAANVMAAKKTEILIEQKDRAFVLQGSKVESMIVKTGDVLRFQNADPFAHNVFSLSPLKKFDLGSYPKGKSKTVVFTKKGTAEIECAIHPQMFLEVTVE